MYEQKKFLSLFPTKEKRNSGMRTNAEDEMEHMM